ncbi:MAG TPA: TetR/AcrR family transcriptional regulator [Pseudonocardiaceae bacterium]|jgi:AcrR family transcriptional regulator|nr:TetR/AcrR family transcriptional regulator [Pseudonocardiaceae bacterium]
MTGSQRRQQLLDVARELLAERGFDATSVEEIAHRAAVSKPVVYAHFGGKEGIYAVVVDREMRRVLDRIESSLAVGGHPRELLERAARAFLAYVEEYPDGFRILVRDSPVAGAFSSLLGDIASRVEGVLGVHFEHYGYDPKLAAVYAHALVGMVAQTGQWWLDVRAPSRDEVAAHLVNLAWNGLSHLDRFPALR